GGVPYERLIVTAEMVAAVDTIKFIPVMRNNPAQKVPHFLGHRMYVDFSRDADFAARLEELSRAIHGAPAVAKPELGQDPVKGHVIPPAEPVRVAGPSGATSTGVPILSDGWFEDQHKAASAGIQTLNANEYGSLPDAGSMEVRFGLHDGLNKTQVELLAAVRA